MTAPQAWIDEVFNGYVVRTTHTTPGGYVYRALDNMSGDYELSPFERAEMYLRAICHDGKYEMRD